MFSYKAIYSCQLFPEKLCYELTIPNSNMVNTTAYFQDSLTVQCDEDHFVFGNESISSYVTMCNASKQFEPVVPCESK